MKILDWVKSRFSPKAEQQESDYQFPRDATVAQILDYVSGGYSFNIEGLPVTRNTAVRYITLHRCVSLIAGAISQLVCGGSMKILDQDGKEVKTKYAGSVREILTYSHDGGINPSLQFIEDMVADYALDGNSLVDPSFDSRGMLTRLRRMRPWDSQLVVSRNGAMVYRTSPADGNYATEYISARRLIHARWPRLLRYGQNVSSRDGFSLAPVQALGLTLEIGLGGDTYVKNWFRMGPKSNLHFDLQPIEGVGRTLPEQEKEIKKRIIESTMKREPVVTYNTKSSKIEDHPQSAEAAALREFTVQETARFYGVPLPLLSVSIRTWGAAVNEQIGKLGYRWGVKQHLDRILAPLQLRLLRPGQRFVVDPTELVKGDAEGIKDLIMALQGDAQRAPIATREELRYIAGLPREPMGEFPEQPRGMAGQGDNQE